MGRTPQNAPFPYNPFTETLIVKHHKRGGSIPCLIDIVVVVVVVVDLRYS
jgi:hypothetical protein